MTDSATRLLNTLFRPEDGLIELRAIKAGTPGLVGRAFVAPGDEAGIHNFIRQYGNSEIYFGPAARRDNSSGGLDNCTLLPAVFTDIDLKDTPDGLKRIQEFIYPPSALVSSGGGYHCYWILKEPANLSEENGRIKSILMRLAHAIGGDLSSAEPAHILRIPSTLNHKPIYPQPRRVELLSLSDARYDLADFDDFLPMASPEEHGEKTALDELSKIKSGKRNTFLASLAGTMRRRNMSEDAIVLALLAENKTRCDPPLDDAEVRAIAHSISQYEPKSEPQAKEESKPKEEFQYIESASTFLAVEDPPINYLINELLPEAVINVDHGDPRTRKTWAGIEVAVAIATGTPAFGMERFKTRCDYPVLYSSQEDTAPIVRTRVKAILRARGIDNFPETLFFSVHKGINLESPEWHQQLLKDIAKYGFRLVILDPIRRFAPSVDKGPSEVREITQFLRRITVETAATVKAIHHDVKPRADSRDDRRRSHKASGGDWFAAAECPIAFEHAGDNNTLVIPEDFKLSCDPEPFSFHLETDDPRTPTWARLIGESSSADDAKLLGVQQKILAYLADHLAGGSGNAIAKTCKIRREDCKLALEKLLQTGKVDCFGEGGKGKKQTWFLKKGDVK
jgi:hypothetical protein